MSNAEELLNSLPENEATTYAAEPSVEPHIVIGTDKFITVPLELRRIATQFEHNVKTVTFDCPRYWDGRDLMGMVICINYKTPNNVFGQKEAENVVVDPQDETMIHFDWVITKNATQANGTLSFLACAVKTDAYGMEEQHWNSELNRDMTVSEGLESAPSILEAYPDVITDILVRLRKVEAGDVTFDETLTLQGYAADAKAVGDKFAALPIGIAKDGFTDIVGLREIANVVAVKDGQSITVTVTKQGDKVHTHTINLDENDRPISGTSNGVPWEMSWEGFDV